MYEAAGYQVYILYLHQCKPIYRECPSPGGIVITKQLPGSNGNRQLNMMEEIKTIQKHFPKIALTTILQWATLNGARALGIENRFGSFEKGKNPGLVLIDEKSGSSKLVL